MAEVQAAVRENEGYLADSAFTIMKKMKGVRAEADGDEKSYPEESDYDEKISTSDEEDVDDESTPTTSPIKDAEIKKYAGYESFDSMNGLVASSVETQTLSDIEITPEPILAEIESEEDGISDTNVDSEEDRDDDEALTSTKNSVHDDNPFTKENDDFMDGKDYLLTDGDLEVIMDPTPPLSVRKRKLQTQEDEDAEQQTEKRPKLSQLPSASTSPSPPMRSEFARYLGAGLLGAFVGAAAMFTGLIAASDDME